MAAAKELIEKFWDMQNDRDYGRLIELFADDAVFEDPAIGRFEGKEAIGKLLERLTVELAGQHAFFEVEEIAGDEECAWSRWIWRRKDGDLHGVGLYRVRDGKLTYYRDFYHIEPAKNAS